MAVVAAPRAIAQLARLSAGIAQLGLDVSGSDQARLLAFIQKLAKWNHAFNLTAVTDPDDMIVVHLLDCLSILPLIDASGATRLLDVGSGAGLPGIPIALLRPAIQVVTVDAVAKKIGFQRQMTVELPLGNLTPMHARVEALTLDKRPDLIVSRAYTAIPDMLASIDALADDRTTVIAMKGVEPTVELAGVHSPWTTTEIRTLDVPFLGARRCAVILRKTAVGATT